MNYQIRINSLAAGIRNGEAVITRFDAYTTKNQDFRKIRLAYLEQAGYCIDAYRSMIADGSDLYQAARMLAKAVYAVRQARSAEFYENGKR